ARLFDLADLAALIDRQRVRDVPALVTALGLDHVEAQAVSLHGIVACDELVADYPLAVALLFGEERRHRGRSEPPEALLERPAHVRRETAEQLGYVMIPQPAHILIGGIVGLQRTRHRTPDHPERPRQDEEGPQSGHQ